MFFSLFAVILLLVSYSARFPYTRTKLEHTSPVLRRSGQINLLNYPSCWLLGAIQTMINYQTYFNETNSAANPTKICKLNEGNGFHN